MHMYVLPFTLDSTCVFVLLQDFTGLAQELFHGNCHDRWFDKCISAIVFSNGVIGSNVEHAPLDATVTSNNYKFNPG